MKHHTPTHRSLSAAFPAILVAATSLLATLSAQAATITLQNDDDSSNNSFVNSGQWSNVAVPTAGNDYVNDGKSLIGAGAIAPSNDYTGTSLTTFAGNSLTLISTVADTKGILGLRWRGEVNVPNLIVNRGDIQNLSGNGVENTGVLGGNMTIQAGGAFVRPTTSTDRYITVNANVSGTGFLHIFQGSVTVAHAGNTHSGGTLIGLDATYNETFKGYATVNQDGAMGTGNVTLYNTFSKLTLTGGATNNYIADTASFLLQDGVTASAITLNFTGTDSIAGLSFDLGNTWAATGTWGATGSGADHESALFTGTGLLNVVPEPSTWALLAGSLTVLMVFRRRRLS